jgi:hypothetical protein
MVKRLENSLYAALKRFKHFRRFVLTKSRKLEELKAWIISFRFDTASRLFPARCEYLSKILIAKI